uniref:Brix domain-containing protein n=1 Tax=Chromera velia CCMP2878 TaxID=1169474 RepID=A0A0G4HWY9_9ALVE|mmetsp:Transcript_6298/g.12472  ORF Transcript_6298/g.12472 Transcript_6298/m.12472 type:complete len:317 (-) Transcript_6298:221-1171(-)|eukprot:Cvel_9172.t1-p1 / transcript=Cvel_9172.t1 / gene=Cvel_9172 / organism=Chromera_velia_CCMP2878 / gene_product=U3 small nucleolar ribonucleoprotein protein IMP4, putative / transcript_product=U3 small nucleolar ribonucleoprotein protein IMP4, putative / location=Cvel_scaffold522:46907-50668(-) / protein_length=316 / sequence_SO=supercontig / SO=protein_coding / is_pseudo=false
MLRKNVRLRKEYLYRKSLEEKEKTISDRKRKLQDALESGKAIPTELRGEERDLRKKLDLTDEKTRDPHSHIDDEYAFAGLKDPRILLTTARDPSSRLTQFAKELRLVIPTAQRVNRGNYVVKDLVQLCRRNDISDLIIVHEHRGEPDGLIVSHLPHGPTAYFGLSDVVLRHDLPEKPANMPEVHPHLVFHNFSSRLGDRVANILKYLFPPAAPHAQRLVSFVNFQDRIHFRHTLWEDKRKKSSRGPEGAEEGEEEEEGRGKKGKGGKEDPIELKEIGPRFKLRIYKIELGTADMTDVETEWTLRPFFNRQRAALAE